MRAVVVVPWRATDILRQRTWEWCRPWWEALGFPLYVVEHEGEEPFNRSWCINEGARRAWPWDVMVVADADVIEDDPAQVDQAISLAHESKRMTVAHTDCNELSQRASRHAMMGIRFDWHRGIERRREGCRSRVNAFPAEVFRDLGGYDERYKGWGWEDSSFIRAHNVLHGDIQHVPGECWHFWHPRSAPRFRHTRPYKLNRELCQRYIAATQDGPETVRDILAEREVVWSPPRETV